MEMLERRSDAKIAVQWSENNSQKCLKYWNSRTLQYPELRRRVGEIMQWEVEQTWQRGMSDMRRGPALGEEMGKREERWVL